MILVGDNYGYCILHIFVFSLYRMTSQGVDRFDKNGRMALHTTLHFLVRTTTRSHAGQTPWRLLNPRCGVVWKQELSTLKTSSTTFGYNRFSDLIKFTGPSATLTSKDCLDSARWSNFKIYGV